jgi:hypothetical protein
MRPIAFLGLFLLLTGCVPPVGDNIRREALAPQPVDLTPSPSAPTRSRFTQPSVGYGGTMPAVPASGLGAEAPMATPKASRMPSIGPGVPPSVSASAPASGQSIMVPNGNGTTTIIHPDGTIETVPTPK